MTTERVKCTDCPNMILPQTAEANGGLCAQCVRISKKVRDERREFENSIESGSQFVIPEAAIDSTRQPKETASGDGWHPEPNYYQDRNDETAQSLFDAARQQEHGRVLLESDSGGRLGLVFNHDLAVCEYQNDEDHNYFFARTPKNFRSQVSVELHLDQPCYCCGVGVGWYHSKSHMPREEGFAIFAQVAGIDSDTNEQVAFDWIEMGDISWNNQGKG